MALVEQFPSLSSHYVRAADRFTRLGLPMHVAEQVLAGTESIGAWPERWEAAGAVWEHRAAEALAQGRVVTAREWFRIAFCCYRLSDFGIFEDSPQKAQVYQATLRTWEEAMKAAPIQPERLAVAYAGVQMPGYLVKPAGARGRVPAAVFIMGADGNKEEQYWNSGLPLAARGVAYLCVDGPGQGYSRRVYKLMARHDWEGAASAMLEYLLSRDDIDPDRIGIVGSSMGGYYAPRAFAVEKRFRCCLVNSALFSAESIWEFYPPVRPQLLYNIGIFDEAAAKAAYRPFTLAGVAEGIDRPLAIHHGGRDRLTPLAGAEELARRVSGPVDLRVWPEGSHNLGNIIHEAGPMMWDWVAEQLSARVFA